MKKFIAILSIFIVLLGINYSFAYGRTYTLELEAVNVTKDFDLYILLPEDYILFVMQEDKLNFRYEGVKTLKDNEIPSIQVNKKNIQNDLYEEDGIKYVQILLEQNEEGKYEFNILSDYDKMDIRYRIKNDERDNIAYIDNFKEQDGVCKIEYNYEKNTIEQHISNFTTILVIILIFILIMIIVLGIMSYIKQRKDRRE